MSDAAGTERNQSVARGLVTVRKRIAAACASAGRKPETVTVVAVTKGFGAEAIEAALAAGIADVGENYYQEAQAKFAAVVWPPHPVRRHFIGRVQRNKAQRIAALFDVVQSLEDLSSAAALDESAASAGKTLDVLVQLNIAGDARAGIPPESCVEFVRELRAFSHLNVRGAMAVAPADAAAVPDAFDRGADAYRRLSQEFGASVFSLGMSGDLETAIAAGSTMVRIGSALFGARPVRMRSA